MAAMARERREIARAAAGALERATPPAVLVGFDGFIDTIIDAVDVRMDMGRGYRRIPTISAFAARCAAAAGRSANIERVIRERRFGGNGPLMAGALARLGAAVTYIGAIGAERGGGIDRVFQGFAAMCRRVIATGPPSHTDCFEFDDGKLMFNETGAVQAVTWERIVEVAGLEELTKIVGGADLIGIVNWSLLGGVPGIWRGLMRDVLPRLPKRGRRLVIDLSDPSKRTDADVREAMDLLRELAGSGLAVTLGLNLNEAGRIGRLVGAPAAALGLDSLGEELERAAGALRKNLGLDTVVVHRHTGAAAADGGGAAYFDGPYTKRPRISTGAGDHFNAGFGMAQVTGLPLEQCLAVACGVSGTYVRDGEAPGRERLVEFLREMPEAE
jgi:sugar/nucleoside kinase (ribokinase family)